MTTERAPGVLLAALRDAVAAQKEADSAHEAALDVWKDDETVDADDATHPLSIAVDTAFAAYLDAKEVVKNARSALLASDEEIPWVLSEDGCDYRTVWCDCAASALAEAESDDGGYNEPTETIWVTRRVTSPDLGETDSVTVTINPDEPECSHEHGHDWQSPYRLVGGLKENPGVFGHGGGVILNSVCMRCGCGRVEDTWAQNRATGEQGLESVSYERGRYADEVSDREIGARLDDRDAWSEVATWTNSDGDEMSVMIGRDDLTGRWGVMAEGESDYTVWDDEDEARAEAYSNAENLEEAARDKEDSDPANQSEFGDSHEERNAAIDKEYWEREGAAHR